VLVLLAMLLPTRGTRADLFTFTPITSNSGPFALFTTNPSINNSGEAAFQNILDTSASGAFKGSGGATTITDTSGMFSLIGANPSINGAGVATFQANLAAGGRGIFAGSGGAITTIADTSGPFSGLGISPSINNLGAVAFFAFLDAGGTGLFTGPDLVANKVIQTGDALDGSTVTALGFFRRGLNDNGQLAFHAVLADGRQGIYRADPLPVQVVPAPPALLLAVVGAAGLVGCRCCRR
jgi:hypothetical protein